MATTKLIDKYNRELSALSSDDLKKYNYVILANDDNANNPTNYKIKCSDFKNWINDDISISQKFNDITGQISQLTNICANLSGRVNTLETENEDLKSRIENLETLLSLSSN